MSVKQKIVLKRKKHQLVDLFSGTGAFSYAFESTNKVNSVFANDFIENSKKIYELNFTSPFILKDLNDIDVKTIPKHDILTGGFPCQPFSIAGHRMGFSDSRSNVFWKIVEIIKHHIPRVVILENVKNLKTHDDGKTFQVILDKIKEIGYQVKYEVLNTCDVSNVPQNRERIYLVCFRDIDDYNRFSFDFPRVKNEDISKYLENNIDSSYYYTNRYKVWDIIESGVKKDISTNTLYQFRRQYVRENKSSVCPTLTSNMGQGGHNVPLLKDNVGIRKLTPRECFNLQGFPKDYKLPPLSDNALYKLAGNAVSVPVVQLIANKIIILLEKV